MTSVASIKTQRAVVMDALSRMKVVRRVYRVDANFVLVRFDDADAVYDHLIGDCIIVRNRNRVKGCEGCLRITMGLKEENDKLLKSLAEYETKKLSSLIATARSFVEPVEDMQVDSLEKVGVRPPRGDLGPSVACRAGLRYGAGLGTRDGLGTASFPRGDLLARRTARC